MADGIPRAADALSAAKRAGGLLSRLRSDPRRALDEVRPYLECDLDPGEKVLPDQREAVLFLTRSIVYGTAADCYRAMKEYLTAAEWYYRAGEQWPTGGFPAFYAEMVVRHQLADHYEPAAFCLRHSLAEWRSRPFLHRAYWTVRSGLLGWWWRPWLYQDMWRTWYRQHANLAELEARIGDRTGGTSAPDPESQ